MSEQRPELNDETKTDITEAEVKDEVILSRHQRSSKHNQSQSYIKVTDAYQPSNKDHDRVKKRMKQKNSAACNLKASKMIVLTVKWHT